MNKFWTFAALALLTGTACSVDNTSAAAHQNIAEGGCLKADRCDGSPVNFVNRRDPAHFVIRAELKWHGNRYGRLSNGIIISTTMAFEWEGSYVVVNGKTIRVLGLPGDIVDQQDFHGKTLVLVGRLTRDTNKGNAAPPDVLIVDRFWSER